MDLDLLDEELAARGLPAYRTRQVREALLRRCVGSWSDVTTLPAALRDELAGQLPWSTVEVASEQSGSDGTIKLALTGRAGPGPFEAVLMEFDGGRQTACLSSQSGCALACSFCATGTLGFGRNLTRHEIVDQFLELQRRAIARGGRIDNVVMMGMGEPFHNYDEVIAACRMLNDPDGIGLGARRIAISTAGWIPGIERLASEPRQFKLALSLHAPTDELRQELMPVNRKYPIAKLMEACRDYRRRTGRRIFVEYLMLDGVNDGPEHARQLARLLGGDGFHVNLIAYNPTGSGYQGSPDAAVEQFGELLRSRSISTSYRISRGSDIDAACGQLAAGQRGQRLRPSRTPRRAGATA